MSAPPLGARAGRVGGGCARASCATTSNATYWAPLSPLAPGLGTDATACDEKLNATTGLTSGLVARLFAFVVALGRALAGGEWDELEPSTNFARRHMQTNQTSKQRPLASISCGGSISSSAAGDNQRARDGKKLDSSLGSLVISAALRQLIRARAHATETMRLHRRRRQHAQQQQHHSAREPATRLRLVRPHAKRLTANENETREQDCATTAARVTGAGDEISAPQSASRLAGRKCSKSTRHNSCAGRPQSRPAHSVCSVACALARYMQAASTRPSSLAPSVGPAPAQIK